MLPIMCHTQYFCFDIMLNNNLFQKFKLIEIGKFNYLINTLTLKISKG
jgi:hypothetical protein